MTVLDKLEKLLASIPNNVNQKFVKINCGEEAHRMLLESIQDMTALGIQSSFTYQGIPVFRTDIIPMLEIQVCVEYWVMV